MVTVAHRTRAPHPAPVLGLALAPMVWSTLRNRHRCRHPESRWITLSSIDTTPHLVARAVSELARRTRFPVAFGGLETAGAIHVTAVHGARTNSLEGLVVRAERGLGGKAFAEHRPRLAMDYRSARSITHDYDTNVLGEGIGTLFAVPVMVHGRARGVLYCGSWGQSSVGDIVATPALDVAHDLATELRISDEVQRRLGGVPNASAAHSPGAEMSASVREELRHSYAELRRIGASVADSGVRAQLAQLESRLAALSAEGPIAATASTVRLSPREIDVLSCVAVGATNAEIGTSLGLKEATVKSYLQTAMSKLDATTRHAAVANARIAGILP
ncbi:LuxR C-terminal-related transcriptional regulator [Microbacterium sp. R86528]|uniref:LuxR C-terminal-related transcriptional regulator n=1 Tax=Microbacterium sp. R86528 TaxID=3093864 RepID=UPI0037C70A15